MGFLFSIPRLDRSKCHLDPVEAQKGTEVLTSLGAPVLAPAIIQESFSVSPFLVLWDSFSTCKQVQGSILVILKIRGTDCEEKNWALSF